MKDNINIVTLDIHDYNYIITRLSKFEFKENEVIEKLVNLIAYGDEWHWDNCAIRDDVINIYELITGRKYEEEEGE